MFKQVKQAIEKAFSCIVAAICWVFTLLVETPLGNGMKKLLKKLFQQTTKYMRLLWFSVIRILKCIWDTRGMRQVRLKGLLFDRRMTKHYMRYVAPVVQKLSRPAKKIIARAALFAAFIGVFSISAPQHAFATSDYGFHVEAAPDFFKTWTDSNNDGDLDQSVTTSDDGITTINDSRTGNEINMTTNENLKEIIENSPEIDEEPTVDENGLTMYAVAKTESGLVIRSSLPQDSLVRYLNGKPVRMLRGSGNSSGMLNWNGYATPFITIDNIGPVFCIEPYEAFPNGDWYNNGTIVHDDGLIAILIWGFPSNYGGQHGLSDEEAYVRTFVAINAYLGNYNRSTVESYGDSYINMLLQKADSKDIPVTRFEVKQPASLEAKYNPVTNRLETDLYTTNGSPGNSYKLPSLPAGVYAVNEAGSKITGSVAIGTKFRLVSDDLTLDTQVSTPVQSSVRPHAAIVYEASGVQKLTSGWLLDPLPPVSIKATFAPAYIAVGGHKTTEDDEFKVIPGATYGLYQADGRELDVVVTDENGDFVTGKVAASLYGSGAYLREIKTADDATYVLDYQKFVLPDLADPAVAAQIIDGVYYVNDNQNIINEYNEIDDLTIAKVDSVTGEPLADAQFEVKRVSGEACPEVTQTTDNNSSDNNVAASVDCQFTRVYTTGTDGYAVIPETDFSLYKYGGYEVRELVAPGGYTRSDEVVTFNIDSDQKIIHITFENDKIDELAVTGEGNFEALVGGLALIALTGGVILISRSKKGRKGAATLAIALLIGAGVFATSGTQVFAATTENNEVEGTQMDEYNKTSKEVLQVFMLRASDDDNFINPLDPSVTVPTDPIPEVAPPPVEENIVAEGNKDGSDASTTTGGGSASTGTSSEDDTLSWYDGPLTNTGQNLMLGVFIGTMLVIIAGIAAFFAVRKRKALKTEE
ncbi:MSCRAMM family protein [Culicoidibacter larvae]|uniref:SpaA-like prealbumin fold domain-containing protein n=1 Tax=Culicoidibacter larvae TaxID=2579976 RepID=A0A5R8QH31_9FIRM|nr:SpaA isopeptide-forming pilin-related protein [Culicoidibacter larvae]TLG77339.1 hypothetical protein FEZ08_01600 [Culicoidibacter larvae]